MKILITGLRKEAENLREFLLEDLPPFPFEATLTGDAAGGFNEGFVFRVGGETRSTNHFKTNSEFVERYREEAPERHRRDSNFRNA